MENKINQRPNLIQSTIHTVTNAFRRYEQTQPTTKIGIALITMGLLSGGLELVLGDPMAAGLCCNTISGLGVASLGVSASRNRANRRRS